MTEPNFQPQTPREALLEIRRILSRSLPSDAGMMMRRLDAVAEEGLTTAFAVGTYETSDQLADRLAEAHRILKALTETEALGPGAHALRHEIAQALVLPPDLEAMVERRRQ